MSDMQQHTEKYTDPVTVVDFKGTDGMLQD